MKLDKKEIALIISALEGDRQGTWGDDRRENLNKIINKLKREGK